MGTKIVWVCRVYFAAWRASSCSSPWRRRPLTAQSRDCDGYFTPLVVPSGSCVRVFADTVGPVRQVIVHPSGQVVAALNEAPGLVRLSDLDNDGHADRIIRFGPGQGGSGVAWRAGWLYFAADSGVIRYRVARRRRSARHRR